MISLRMHIAVGTLAPVLMTCGIARGEATGEVEIGQNAAGRLVALVGFSPPKAIPRSAFPNVDGYATGAIGFENTPIDHEDEGVFMIAETSDIRAIMTHRDPGIMVYDGLNALAVGGSMHFGAPFFDYHPLYAIPSWTATNGQPFEVRFILHDDTGTYSDSEEFAIVLTPACHADVDDGSGTGTIDEGVDINDLLYFLGMFESGVTGADLDNGLGLGIPDGGVDINDLLFFLTHFEAGC